MPHTLRDVLPVSSRVNESGHLEIGGCDSTELATEFGTPLFVFCEQTFRRRSKEFIEAFPGSNVFYAAKAFLCGALCRMIEQEGLFLDVASGGELHTALAANFPPERLILHGNNKEDADILRAVEAGVGRIAIDNLEEIARVSVAAKEFGKQQTVVIRVTPGVEAHTHHYIQTGQEDSKFGIPIYSQDAIEAMTAASEDENLDLAGIHCHIGSNIFSYDPFGKTIEIVFEFLAKVKAANNIKVREIDLGGGIGIPYVAGDFPIKLGLFSDLILETVRKQAAHHGLELPEIGFEPGRFLIGNAMVTLYSVGAIKDVPGVRTFVAVDGGMSDNIRPALYQARYAAIVANKAMQETGKVVSIAGMHCESGDILIRDVPVPSSIERGDIIAVPATGAYGYSMASNYNKQPKPAVVLVRQGKGHVIVRRESFDDLLSLDESLPE